MDTKWVLADVPSVEKIDSMVAAVHTSRLVAAILCVRGFSPSEAEKFIKCDINDIYDPFLLKDMDKAAERIKKAKENGEKVTVFGDYDADGVTSVTIMIKTLEMLGIEADYYIPDRETEGYGISIKAIDVIASRNSNLIISVDCGITAVEECEYAKKLNIDMVITDHHECGDILPDAKAVVDVKRKDCPYPFKGLAGVGVALKLSQALMKDRYSYIEVLKIFSEYAALGSIADIVPLVDENRIICKTGLKKMRENPSLGIGALLKASAIDPKTVSASRIGFTAAPRINAAGRLESAEKAAQLFFTDNKNEAEEIAYTLNEYNRERQQIETEIFKEAEKYYLKHCADDKIIVLCKKEWHHGVVGIVSSRLTKKYMKPCILLSAALDSNYKGSGRSVEGFSLYDALEYTRDLLVTFGGHELAVGLTIKKENIEMFRKKINEYASKKLDPSLAVEKIYADCELRGRHLGLQTARDLSVLTPFGTGNGQPQFYIKNLTVNQVCRIGSEKQHLRMVLSKDGVQVNAVAFGFGKNCNLRFNDVISVICQLDVNEYRNTESLQLRIIDIK